MTRYYIEHDGRILTIQRDGQPDLPTEDEVDVPFETIATRQIAGAEVVFGQAELDEHPWDWPSKDDLAWDESATALVHGAINASLFRPVVGVIVRHGDRVLLVEPARGVAKGHWTLPGGFLHAFEQPGQGARREVREEAGLEITDLDLVGTFVYTHPGVAYPILGLAFTAQAATDEIEVREEEIRAARWFTVANARDASGGFAASVLERLGKEGRL